MDDKFFFPFRRLLIGVSLALIFLRCTDLRVDLLLNDALPTSKVWVIYALVWLAGIYALTGFCLYFIKERYLSFWLALNTAKVEGIRGYLHKLAERRSGSAASTDPCDPVSVWPMDAEVEIYRRFEGRENNRSPGAAPNIILAQETVVINRFLWIFYLGRATFLRLISGVIFFEYVLPLALFALAAIFAGQGEWRGSVLNVYAEAVGKRSLYWASPRAAGLQLTICDWGANVQGQMTPR